MAKKATETTQLKPEDGKADEVLTTAKTNADATDPGDAPADEDGAAAGGDEGAESSAGAALIEGPLSVFVGLPVVVFQKGIIHADINNPGYKLVGDGPYAAIVTHWDDETKTAHLTMFIPSAPSRTISGIPHKSVAATDATTWFEHVFERF